MLDQGFEGRIGTKSEEEEGRDCGARYERNWTGVEVVPQVK
ncbi:unnamed protein product [marine sediment metagenome]|uniref:Uncharacterized protein n=1 Tax=marine sediment metagenome TaxID=412755 RepID=X0U8S4_9ZZZZ